jgi:hypothetical protein
MFPLVSAATAVLAGIALSGCPGSSSTPDGRADAGQVDAAIDARIGCTGAQEFTGELIDFDSSPSAFQGVFDAVFTMRGEPTCTATTAPNGRFILSVPLDVVEFDVDAPGDYLDGIWPVDGGLIASATNSSRALAEADLVGLGVATVPGRGHLMLYQDAVAPLPLGLTGDPDGAFTTADGETWAPGNDQRYILFTNVAPGVQMVTDDQAITAPTGRPLVEAGKVTHITTRQP